jgi:RNA polymerase sigma-70 factor (ECF subfamily)
MDQHAAALLLYARQWCSAPEDVVQEAFVKLAGKSPAPANALAWLYRVVRNGAISAQRAERRRRHHEGRAATRTVWFTMPEQGGIEVETLTQAMQTLPMQQREAIVAHLWGGLTFEQFAELMSSSTSSVHRWYLAGLTALRERMGVPCPKSTTQD